MAMRRKPAICRTIPRLLIVFLILSAPIRQALAQESPPNPLREVAFDQKLNAQVPVDLQFLDENGNIITLQDFLDRRPTILLFAYYECPMLCSVVFADLAKNIQDLNLEAGKDYQTIIVSMDAEETPKLAASKKAAYFEEYPWLGDPAGWHFLTGTREAIESLAHTTGFRFAYDAKKDEYAHPTGLILLTPEGLISRYYFGFEYTARDLRLGLVEASREKIGSTVDHLLLLCFQYDPEQGKYNLLISNVLRYAGVATVFALSIGVIALYRRESQSESHD